MPLGAVSTAASTDPIDETANTANAAANRCAPARNAHPCVVMERSPLGWSLAPRLRAASRGLGSERRAWAVYSGSRTIAVKASPIRDALQLPLRQLTEGVG